MKFGLELELFLRKGKNYLQASNVTSKTDGNLFIAELRTNPFDSIEEAVFDLKRLIFLFKKEAKGKYSIDFKTNQITLTIPQIRKLRNDSIKKENTPIFSLYGQYPNILPIDCLRASLQINISDNVKINNNSLVNGIIIKDTKNICKIFNYVDIIKKLDKGFKEEISKSNRTPGIYSIKDGIFGDRIEYRSLPNTVKLDKIIEVINN